MNNKQNLKDAIIGILLLITILALLNPMDILMPSTLQMILIGIFGTLVLTILIFIWRENPKDEREETHILLTNRISFFVVSVSLLIALIVQTINHTLDIWIPLSLGLMLLAKIFSLIYFRNRM